MMRKLYPCHPHHVYVLNHDPQDIISTKSYKIFTKICLCKLYLRIDITKTYITSSRLIIFHLLLISYTRYLEVSLITLDSEKTQLAIHINLIFLLFFCQISQKTTMLISMTKLVMNVTYHHSNISIILPHRNIINIHTSKKICGRRLAIKHAKSMKHIKSILIIEYGYPT